MTYHVIEPIDKGKLSKAKQHFMDNVCSICSSRYECITHGYRMNITTKEKFVLIPEEQRQMQVECHHMQRLREKDNLPDKQ